MRNYTRTHTRWCNVESLMWQQLGVGNQTLFHNSAVSSVSFVKRFELSNELKFHDGCVNAVNFNQNGDLIVSGSDDLKIALWDWLNMPDKPLFSYNSGHSSNVFQTKFMPNTNDSVIASCARDGQVRVGYLSNGGYQTYTKKLAQHRGAAHRMSIDIGSSNSFKTAGEDGVIFNVDLREDQPNKLLTVINEHQYKVTLYSISINPGSPHEFAVAGRNPWTRVYDCRKISDKENSYVKRFCPDELKCSDEQTISNVSGVTYNYNGSDLLCSYNENDVFLFDSSHSSESNHIRCYKGHKNADTVKGANFFGARSEYVVSGSDCSHIFIWERDSEKIVNFLHGDVEGVVNVLEPHPNQCILATAGLDHEVKLWQPTGETFSNEAELKEQIELNADLLKGNRTRVSFDFEMFQLLVGHRARERRRRMRFFAMEGVEDSDELSSDSTTDSDSTT